MRKPATTVELDEVMNFLSASVKLKSENLLDEAKNLKLNSLRETARVLKLALINQKSTGKEFDLSKRGIVSEAVDLMLEEVALVYKISLEKAFEKIKKASRTYYTKL